MPLLTSKVTPAQQEQKLRDKNDAKKKDEDMFVMLLHTLVRKYGVQRRVKSPKKINEEVFKKRETEKKLIVYDFDFLKEKIVVLLLLLID